MSHDRQTNVSNIQTHTPLHTLTHKHSHTHTQTLTHTHINMQHFYGICFLRCWKDVPRHCLCTNSHGRCQLQSIWRNPEVYEINKKVGGWTVILLRIGNIGNHIHYLGFVVWISRCQWIVWTYDYWYFFKKNNLGKGICIFVI